jgi:hypothetical protein
VLAWSAALGGLVANKRVLVLDADAGWRGTVVKNCRLHSFHVFSSRGYVHYTVYLLVPFYRSFVFLTASCISMMIGWRPTALKNSSTPTNIGPTVSQTTMSLQTSPLRDINASLPLGSMQIRYHRCR